MLNEKHVSCWCHYEIYPWRWHEWPSLTISTSLLIAILGWLLTNQEIDRLKLSISGWYLRKAVNWTRHLWFPTLVTVSAAIQLKLPGIDHQSDVSWQELEILSTWFILIPGIFAHYGRKEIETDGKENLWRLRQLAMGYFCSQIYAVRCGLTKCPITSQATHRCHYEIGMDWVRGAHRSAEVGTGQEAHSWELELHKLLAEPEKRERITCGWFLVC